jgi:hypothetical protein
LLAGAGTKHRFFPSCLWIVSGNDFVLLIDACFRELPRIYFVRFVSPVRFRVVLLNFDEAGVRHIVRT